MRTSLQLDERKLTHSGLALREDLVLWLCSLISLISSTMDQTDYFVRRYARAAKELNIQNLRELEDALKVYPPLSVIDENNVSKLCRMMSVASPV